MKDFVMCIVFALALGCFIMGCAPMMDMDARLWGYTKATSQPGTTVLYGGPTTAAQSPPPIIEAIAGILAVLGFGGTAAYVRSVGRGAAATAQDHGDSLDALATRVETIAAKVGLPPPQA